MLIGEMERALDENSKNRKDLRVAQIPTVAEDQVDRGSVRLPLSCLFTQDQISS